MLQNALNFLLHFLFFCQLNFCHFRCRVDTHSGAKDLQKAHTDSEWVCSHRNKKWGKKHFQPKTREVEESKLYLDLVCVHASVGDKDVYVLDPSGLINTDLLVK